MLAAALRGGENRSSIPNGSAEINVNFLLSTNCTLAFCLVFYPAAGNETAKWTILINFYLFSSQLFVRACIYIQSNIRTDSTLSSLRPVFFIFHSLAYSRSCFCYSRMHSTADGRTDDLTCKAEMVILLLPASSNLRASGPNGWNNPYVYDCVRVCARFPSLDRFIVVFFFSAYAQS